MGHPGAIAITPDRRKFGGGRDGWTIAAIPPGLIPAANAPIIAGVNNGSNFAEPWEARAFALVVQMAAAGHFTWPEWGRCLAAEVAAALAADAAGRPAPAYYEQWLAAAEKLMIAKGITSADQLSARQFAIASVGGAHVAMAATGR